MVAISIGDGTFEVLKYNVFSISVKGDSYNILLVSQADE